MKYGCLFLLFLLYALPAGGTPAQCRPPAEAEGFHFLNPRVVDFNSQLAPFFLHFGAVYREELGQPGNQQRADNVAEWHERFCDQVDAADIEAIVYGDNLNQLETLRRLLDVKDADSDDLPPALQPNAFARHLLDDNCREVVDYLIYAKRVEPFVTSPANAFQRRNISRADMEALLETGLQRFPRLESHYVRLRYAYQLIRLAHYLGEHAYVLELYDYLMPKVDADPSLLNDWIEGHRAGALQALGDYPQSAYLFSRIFERSPSKRESAYHSFRIQTDEQWKQALLLCQNDHERAMLHVLRAHNGRAVVLEEMRHIYGYEPGNEALVLLAMRELQELERELLGGNLRDGGPSRGATDRVVAMQTFVNRIVEEGKTDHSEFWQFARGVLELLAGDYFYAERTLSSLAGATDSDSLRQQIGILHHVIDVLQLSRVTDSVELRYYNLLTDADIRQRYPDFRELVHRKLEAVYRQSGQQAKANLLRYGFGAIAKNPGIESLLTLERLADSLNRFDRALFADRMGSAPRVDIQNLIGNHYLQRGQWKAALEIYRRIPTESLEAYGRFAPFERQLRDRVHYNPPADAATYNKVQLLQRLDELEEEADRSTNDTLAARNYFNIGLALYNLSYFSYNWAFADVFRSGSSAARAAAARTPTSVFSHVNAPLGNLEHFSMDQPLYYFERALRRAPDREAAALAAYYAAKAERNQHYALGRPGGERPFTYFSILRDDYADTEFYDELIAECRTFAWYVGR
ncbi:hypothetical protein GGR26_003008 [Lewinella marina]|uniref:Tetratricopeptide repeat protein n=1 Tax=Neolewinella marina TaxID=438751 RepID=A0A2G0CEQ5_9BACT|nr:hypothetical protein [Neolewinella marina]NJB87228.1 hypothetical protein [Neolewinella marina]PHK98445.1 hypothetical protein CGL56_12195 [Neolewinella marina]